MITSAHNARIQQVRKLLSRRRERRLQNLFVVEGVRLGEEAEKAGTEAEFVLIGASLSERGRLLADRFSQRGIPVEEVEETLLRSLSDTETPQGMLVVLPLPAAELPQPWDFLVVADNLRDPGNLGTLLRSAAAAGAHGLLVTPGTTDPFAPKVVRAGMGAHFRLPIRAATWDEIGALCQQRPGRAAQILVANSGSGTSCWQTDLTVPLALVIGSEAEGAQPEARTYAGGAIHIPMPGQSESLNAGVAAGILLFEIVRQRAS